MGSTTFMRVNPPCWRGIVSHKGLAVKRAEVNAIASRPRTKGVRQFPTTRCWVEDGARDSSYGGVTRKTRRRHFKRQGHILLGPLADFRECAAMERGQAECFDRPDVLRRRVAAVMLPAVTWIVAGMVGH